MPAASRPVRPDLEAHGTFIRAHGPTVWRLLRGEFGRAHHRGGRCWQRPDPLNAARAPGRTLCEACSSDWADTMLYLAEKVDRKLERTPSLDVARFVRVATVSAHRSARDRRDAERGLATRPNRRVQAQWVSRVVADEHDRALLLRVLWFARGTGPARGGTTVLPYERWAHELDLETADVVGRVERVLAAARDARPGWVDANVDRPLSERLATHGLGAFGDVERAAMLDVA